MPDVMAIHLRIRYRRKKIDMTSHSPLQNGGESELAREITVTLLVIVLYRVGLQIPIPFVNENVLTHFFVGKSFERISIYALGLMPYVSASILVEIGSLFIPFLKKLRRGDYTGRRKLRGYALWMTLFFGVLQGTGIVKGLAGMAPLNGVPVLEVRFFYEYALIVLVLTGGVFLLILAAELISRYGIGNGVSVILLAGICAGCSHNFVKAKQLFGEVGPSPYLLALFFVFIIALLILILLRTNINVPLRHSLVGEPINLFQLNTCPSGTVAIPYAVSLIMLPATLFHFLGGGDHFLNVLSPGSFSYQILLVVFIFVLSYLFAYLFFHPKRRLKKLSERGWQFHENEHVIVNYLSRKLLIYNFPWTALLCALAIIPHIFITQFNVPFYIGGSTFFVAVVISIDVLERVNVLRKSKAWRLYKIAELHDIYDASMIKSHMESEGIICHFQGYYHRHLLYFFGPYIDISVKVVERDRQSAEELIRKYYNGLGLLKE